MKTSFATWVKHGIKRGRFEWDRQKITYALALLVALTFAAALYLVLVSHTAMQGRHIERLRSELLRLEAENERLQEQIARAASVPHLAERATQLGFAPLVAGQVEYLVIPDEGAEQP
jgi:hypothetical protein